MSAQHGPGDSWAFQTPAIPLVVFTDLDGTLLDHHDYSYTAALPALARLAALQVPVIASTSKTLAEVRKLKASLQNPHPCIVENGSALCIPKGYFSPSPPSETGTVGLDAYLIENLGPSYMQICTTLAQLRQQHNWRFTGFSDMSATAVADETGLSHADATLAKKRTGSEPLLWQDTEASLKDFTAALDSHGLTLTRGGRFWHVMGHTSKAKALHKLCDDYHKAGLTNVTRVACGDSPNDQAMLATADIAVVIRRPDNTWLAVDGLAQTIRTDAIGPAGWNAALHHVLDALNPPTPEDTEA